MIVNLLLIAIGVLAAVVLGVMIGLWLVSREKADDAEQTWQRTAGKETKPPPIKTPSITASEAEAILRKNLAEAKPRESIVTAQLKPIVPASPPDDITVARVKRKIAARTGGKGKTRR